METLVKTDSIHTVELDNIQPPPHYEDTKGITGLRDYGITVTVHSGITVTVHSIDGSRPG